MSSGGVEILGEARDELTEGVRFYRAREPEIAAAFLREVRAAFQLLGERPEVGRPGTKTVSTQRSGAFPCEGFLT